VFFLNFVAPRESGNTEKQYGYSKDHFGHDSWGGLVMFGEQPQFSSDEESILKLFSSEIIAYMIGDFISPKKYEVVTAWVDKKYKGMDLAVKMYVKAMVELRAKGCTHMVFDLIDGGLERIINATPVFKAMVFFKLHRIVYSIRKKSYEMEISANKKEQFEQIHLDLRIMIPSMYIFRSVMTAASWFSPNAKRYAGYFDFLDGDSVRKNSHINDLEEMDEMDEKNEAWWIGRIIVGISFGTILSLIVNKTLYSLKN